MPDVSDDEIRGSTSEVLCELRPRQVQAAVLLVQGHQGRQVAAMLKVAEVTISRWRQQPEFQALLRELLQQHVDAMRLNMIALTGEAISELRNLVHAFADETALKACAVVLNRAAPILNAIGAELRQSPANQSAGD